MHDIVKGCLEALIWSEQSDEDSHRDFTDMGIGDCSFEALYEVSKRVLDFISDERVAPILHTIDYGYKAYTDFEMIGHDLALTMNRHGAGFWDRDFGDLGELLTEVAQELGGIHLYIYEKKIEVEY